MLMTAEHPLNSQPTGFPAPTTEAPAFMRLGAVLEAWSVGGEEAALSFCKTLAEERPAAARVAVLEIEGLLLYERWIRDTGLPMPAASRLMEALGGATKQFFQGDPLESGLRLVPLTRTGK